MHSLYCALVVILLAAPVAAAGNAVPPGVAACLKCHASKSLSFEFKDGSEMSLTVNAEGFLSSVHGRELSCGDCHQGYADDHPEDLVFQDRRDYRVKSYELCRKCHFDTYTRTLESVHFGALKRGSKGVPVCTDCHGAHEIHDPRAKRVMISRSCASCHKDVYAEYGKSVHGAALAEDNPDVPACADCHTAHSIQTPDNGFHLASAQTCIRCHVDPKRMNKYGLPTSVASTYLADFHGVTAGLAKGSNLKADQLVVVCADCHGNHAIARVDQAGRETMKGRAAQACTKCHQDAPRGFPDAWLSHYPPSLHHAPLVYAADLFYSFLIPVMVLGLVLQIGLHLYRATVRR